MSEQLNGIERIQPRYNYESIDIVDGVKLDIYFLGSHTAESDLGEPGQFKSILRDADIFLHEVPAWTQADLVGYNKVAKGDYKIYQRIKQALQLGTMGAEYPDFHGAVYSALYNTRTAVAFIDMPDNHPRMKDVYAAVGEKSRMSRLGESLDEVIEQARTWSEAFSKAMLMREDYMLSSFAPTVEAIIQANPKLTAKRADGSISVVMLIGGMHAGLYEGFSERQDQLATENIPRRFEVTPHYGFKERLFPYGEQIHNRHIRDLEVDDELLVKFILTDELFRIESVKNRNLSTDEIVQYIMPEIDNMSEDELRGLWNSLHGDDRN